MAEQPWANFEVWAPAYFAGDDDRSGSEELGSISEERIATALEEAMSETSFEPNP